MTSPGADPKRPFGGLVPSQPKGTRAYQDAATYNHHLAQHQAYTAQAQSQAANTFRNPYITPQSSQHSTPAYAASEGITPTYQSQQQQPAPATQQQPQHPQYAANPPAPGQRGLAHQSSTGQLGTNTSTSQYPNHTTSLGTAHLTTNTANPYIPTSRARANTINQMDSVPPALARLQQMNQDVIAGRNTLTPILNRDDAMREWERRQAGKVTAAQPYPQLEYLQQQAEMAATTGMSNWTTSQDRKSTRLNSSHSSPSRMRSCPVRHTGTCSHLSLLLQILQLGIWLSRSNLSGLSTFPFTHSIVSVEYRR